MNFFRGVEIESLSPGIRKAKWPRHNVCIGGESKDQTEGRGRAIRNILDLVKYKVITTNYKIVCVS